MEAPWVAEAAVAQGATVRCRINFRQLSRVGSTESVNVLVQSDRIGKYAHTQPDWTQTLRFRITKGMEPVPAAAVDDLGEANKKLRQYASISH